MTADEVLATCRALGVQLEARGDRLHYEAPHGTMTPELRDALVRHKPELLAALAPVSEFVSFKGGLVLPLPVVLLALDLERRGFKQAVDGTGSYLVEPAAALTEADRLALVRWRHHLGALISYDVDRVEALQ